MYRSKLLRIAMLCLLFALFATWALAEPVGWVQTAQGPAEVVTVDGQSTPAAYDVPINATDMLRTGAGGSMQVMFRDKTVLALGENAVTQVNDVYTQDGEGSFAMAVLGGTARVISSKIASENPDKFKISTPLSVIGIRGTEFGFVVEGDQEAVKLYAGGPVIFTDTQKLSDQVALCEDIVKTLWRANTAYPHVAGMGVIKLQQGMAKLRKIGNDYGCFPK